MCFRLKIQGSKADDYEFYQRLSRSIANNNYESSLRYLSELYTSHGFIKCVPRLRNVLEMLAPFNQAIGTMVQSDPQVAALVWGSVQIVFQVKAIG